MAHRIRTLFLSAQQPIISALMSFFCNDPLILPTFDDYSNFAELVNSKCKKHTVIVFDDDSLNQKEFLEVKEFIHECNDVKTILYSGGVERKYFRYFLQCRVDGIVSKKENIEKLRDAIIAVSENRKYYDYLILDLISSDDESEKTINILTAREQEIISMVRDGMHNKEIAEKLYLSVKTVEVHKENIKKKLGLISLTGLDGLKIPLKSPL